MPTHDPNSPVDPSVDLQGLTILVTRPAEQAKPLCKAINDAGGVAIHYPSIEIVPIPYSGEQDPLTADIGIFISRNAVRYALDNFPQLANSSLETITVGQGSADEYHQITGDKIDFTPHQHFNSEGVLSLPKLTDVDGKEIILFKGEGGRDKIESELNGRGAKVFPIELYRRIAPACPPPVDWSTIDIVITTSNMALENLWTMTSAAHRQELLAKPLVVISNRGEKLAQELGFNYHPILANSADTSSLMHALQEWQMNNRLNN